MDTSGQTAEENEMELEVSALKRGVANWKRRALEPRDAINKQPKRDTPVPEQRGGMLRAALKASGFGLEVPGTSSLSGYEKFGASSRYYSQYLTEEKRAELLDFCEKQPYVKYVMARAQTKASGLVWTKVDKPSDGKELVDENLSVALGQKTTFTEQEWKAFGIKRVYMNYFIRSGESYFEPVDLGNKGSTSRPKVEYYIPDEDGRRPIYDWGQSDQLGYRQAGYEMPPILREIADKLNSLYGCNFNQAIILCYDTGKDQYAGAHHDKHPLGFFANISLGYPRLFQVVTDDVKGGSNKRIPDGDPRLIWSRPLQSGSLTLLSKEDNDKYKHLVPPDPSQPSTEVRFSVIYREVRDRDDGKTVSSHMAPVDLDLQQAANTRFPFVRKNPSSSTVQPRNPSLSKSSAITSSRKVQPRNPSLSKSSAITSSRKVQTRNPSSSKSSAITSFATDSRIVIQGLVNQNDLNGKTATVRDFDYDKGRWVVALDSARRVVLVKPQNVVHENEAFTLTFGDRAENHVGMQMIGNASAGGLSLEKLHSIQEELNSAGVQCVMIDLGQLVDEDAPEASVLVIPNGVCALLSVEEGSEEILAELRRMPKDYQMYDYGQVKPRYCRHNNTMADFDQDPDIANKMGTVVNFEDYPVTRQLRLKLATLLGVPPLVGELNHYYVADKCGIGFHGDSERKIVVGARFGPGADGMYLQYQWYRESNPVGAEGRIVLKAGDIYIASEKAVGSDWKKRKDLTLRHAAGRDSCKYSRSKEGHSVVELYRA